MHYYYPIAPESPQVFSNLRTKLSQPKMSKWQLEHVGNSLSSCLLGQVFNCILMRCLICIYSKDNFFKCKINEFKYSGGIADCQAVNSWIHLIVVLIYISICTHRQNERAREGLFYVVPQGNFSSNLPGLVSYYLLLA